MGSRKYRIRSGRVENLFWDRTGFPEVFHNSSLSKKLGFSRILKLYELKYGATIITIYFLIKHYNLLYNLIIRECRNSWETRKSEITKFFRDPTGFLSNNFGFSLPSINQIFHLLSETNFKIQFKMLIHPTLLKFSFLWAYIFPFASYL